VGGGFTASLKEMVHIGEYSSYEEAEDAKLLGNAAFQRKEYDVAIKQYTKAIQIQSDGALHIFYSNRAACWIALKDWEKGLEDATSSVAINPQFVKGHFRRIVALCELGQIDEAREVLGMVRGFDGLSPAELADLDRLEGAISTAETRVAADCSTSGSPRESQECSWDAGDLGFEMKRLGNEAFKNGLFDQAVEHYTEAIQRLDAEGLEDEVAVCQNNRAAAFQQLGDHRRVEEDCTQALSVLPKKSTSAVKALIRRGLAREALELYKDALADMTTALQLDSRSSIASKARNRLQKLVRANEEEFVLVCPDSPSAEIGVAPQLGIDEISI